MATEDELAEVGPRLLGMIDESRIVRTRIARPDAAVVKAFLEITDLCSGVSDALDELGVGGAVPSSRLSPVIDGTRIVGAGYHPALRAGRWLGGRPVRPPGRALLADRDLYGVGQAGDVAVFASAGGPDVSVTGGLSATWAKSVGIAGCVVDGSVRDIGTIRSLGQRVWSAGRTPITGTQRLEAVEINGTVSVGGVQLRPGDLVIADETGVCVVPQDQVAEVLERCQSGEAKESTVTRMLEEGRPVSEIVATLPADRW